VLAQLALIVAFTGALAKPSLRDAHVGVVAPAGAAITQSAPPGVSYRMVSTAADARRQVRDGDLPAALVVAGDTAGVGDHATLYVAGAAGPSLTAAFEQALTTEAQADHTYLTVQDLRPLPSSDPRGFGAFLLVIGWVIGGYLGMMLLTRVLGPVMRSPRGVAHLLGWTLGYAVASAGLGVLLVGPIMGVVTTSPVTLIAAGTLIVFTVATFTAAMLSLIGLPGLIIAVGTLVILGNPTSGGAVPPAMLARGWRVLADILPTNAGVSLVHGIAYYANHQIATPLTTLAIYASASILVLVALAVRRQMTARTVPATVG